MPTGVWALPACTCWVVSGERVCAHVFLAIYNIVKAFSFPTETTHTGVSPKCVKSKRRRKRKKEERVKVGNNNGQLQIAMPPCVAHAKPPGPI